MVYVRIITLSPFKKYTVYSVLIIKKTPIRYDTRIWEPSAKRIRQLNTILIYVERLPVKYVNLLDYRLKVNKIIRE